jgi:hypothetical protein
LTPVLYHIIRLIISFTGPLEAKERDVLFQSFNREFESANFQEAVDIFEYLNEEGFMVSLPIKLKAIDSYYVLGDTAKMNNLLKPLENTHSPTYKSIVYNQKAQLSAYAGDTLSAINLLKMAIEFENNNNFVKRNYELLSKLYKPNKNRPPSNQQNQNSGGKVNEGGIVADSDKKEDELESTDPPEINNAQALQLLDAMRSDEYYKLPVLFDSKSDTLDYGKW